MINGEALPAIVEGAADAAIVYYHLARRYRRIFPDLFEIVPLCGASEDLESIPQKVIGTTHAGLIGKGGQWGRR